MRTFLFAALLVSAGCAHTAQQPGIMANGTITPCQGMHVDRNACGHALFNAPRLAAIHTGMTLEDVRAAMGHDPERRSKAPGRESWGYISDYKTDAVTWLTFKEGRVAAIAQVAGGPQFDIPQAMPNSADPARAEAGSHF
jgi:hypothetical protein